jgi:L-fuconolactonase
VIDSHQHFWKFSAENYSWIDASMKELQRDFGPADLERELRDAGVDGTVLVEARGHIEETETILAIANANEFVRGVVGWLPTTGDEFEAQLDRFAANPKLRGIRHAIGAEPDRGFIERDDFNRSVAMLRKHGLAFDIMVWPDLLGKVPAFVDRHPDQVFILDHLAKPYIREGKMEPWRTELRELAKRQNVYCKVSGMVTEADWSRWTAGGLKPYFETALEAFTPKRLMFGSDWPVCTLASTYSRWLKTLKEWIAPLSESERERILGGTAIEAYCL